MATQSNEVSGKLNSLMPDAKNKKFHARQDDQDENETEKMSHEVGRKFGNIASQIERSAAEYLDTSKTYIKANPAKGALIAATAGLFLGSIVTFLLGRRSR